MPTPTNDMMDSGYAAAPAVEPPAEPSETVDEENAGAAEILIAKDKLPSGTKEGDTCTFRVVKDFGDEFSLEYVSEETGEETEETMNATTGREIAALDTEGAV